MLKDFLGETERPDAVTTSSGDGKVGKVSNQADM